MVLLVCGNLLDIGQRDFLKNQINTKKYCWHLSEQLCFLENIHKGVFT